MKNRLRKMMLGIVASLYLVSMPVYAAEDINDVFKQGVEYAQEEKFEEAVESFIRIIEITETQNLENVDLYDVYRNIAICYGNLDMNYKAIEALQTDIKLTEEAEKKERLPVLYNSIADKYNKAGNYQKAIEYGKKAIDLAPHEYIDNAYLLTGNALMSIGAYEEAISYFEIYRDNVKEDEDYLHGVDKIAQCYEKMGDYENAMQGYLEVATDEDYVNGYTKKALLAKFKDKTLTEEQREELVQTYMVEGLDFSDLQLLDFYFSAGRADKVAECVERVMEQEPSEDAYIEAFYGLGGSKCNHGDYAEAEEAFRKVYETAPDYGNTILYLGYALDGLGRYEEALEKYYEVLEKDPENASTILQIIESLLELDRKEEAITMLHDAIMVDGNVDVSLLEEYVNLNNDFSNTDFCDEIEVFSKAKEWPEDEILQAHFIIDNVNLSYFSKERLEAYCNYLESQDISDAAIATELGYAYRYLGEYEMALEYLEMAKKADAYTSKELLQKEIEILHYAGDYGKAIEVANQAAALYEGESDFIYYAAFLDMLFNDNYENAVSVGTDLSTKADSVADGFELLYLTYFTKGDYAHALYYVDKYLEVVDNSSYAKAYKLRILRELGQTDAELEKEMNERVYSVSNTDNIYVPAILKDAEKVKANLAAYLETFSSDYSKAAIANNTAMMEMIADPEIAALLDIAVEEVVEETTEETVTEEEASEEASAEETVAESANKVNTGAIAKTAVSAFIMLLGVGIVVINLRKSKKK